MLIWIARIALLLLAVATLLPLLPVGSWFVRLCDFPRLQIATLLTLPLVFAGYRACTSAGWRSEAGLLVAVAVLLIVWQLSHVVHFSPLWPKELPTAQESQDNQAVRLVIANLEVGNSQHAAVLDVLSATSPDLLLLIEIDDAWEQALQTLRESFVHHVGVVRGEGLGIVLWSKWPLKESEVRHLVSDRRASIFATIEAPSGQDFRFVGVHPTPPGLADSTGEGRHDSRVRDAEFVLVAKEVQQEQDEAWMVTGDFNDVAWSHTTRLFKRLSGLLDPRVGRKLLTTYHAEYPPLRFPIDHVFLSPGFAMRKLERTKLPGSDHFGIVAEFELPVREGVHPNPTQEDREEAEDVVEEGEQDARERNVESDDPR